MAAFDMGNPEAVVSPGGVGFDINCGVRLVRTNLFERDVEPIKEQLAQVRYRELRCSYKSDILILFFNSHCLIIFQWALVQKASSP